VAENVESKRDIGQEILDGLREYNDYKDGKRTLPSRRLAKVSSPLEIRSCMNLSQVAFASLLGVSVRTLQEWEQGRRTPRGPAKALLRIVEQHPEVLLDLR
jgi:putative transcriptional regulator